MAILQLVCQDCNHLFYDIQVACNKAIESICPLCENNNIEVKTIARQDEKPAVAPCKHRTS